VPESLDISAEETECGPEASGPAIDARGLARRFGEDVTAVDGVDLIVQPGEVFGLVGPDGAGKSTLIRMLATVLAPSEGEALVFGCSVTQAPKRVTPRIGYMSQTFSLYGDLTVRENLEFFAELRGVHRREIDARSFRLLEFGNLLEFQHRQAQYLSGGMKQKLALAVTLIHEPDLLLLDEPTTGVDPVARREFWRIIAGLRRQGITVFVATPYMDEAERCTTVAFMDRGRITLMDNPVGLKARLPGTLYEVVVEEQRAALRVLEKITGVASATIFGETLRILTEPDGPDERTLADSLRRAGLEPGDIQPTPVDMEATFAYLAEVDRPRDEEDASGQSEPAARDAIGEASLDEDGDDR